MPTPTAASSSFATSSFATSPLGGRWVLVAACLFAVLPACGGEADEATPAPEAVYAKAQTAMSTTDVQGLVALLTPESLDATAFFAYIMTSSAVDGMNDSKKHLIEPIKAVYGKHGVKIGKGEPEGVKGVAAVLKGNAAAFIADIAGVDPDITESLSGAVEGKLADVKFDGTSARGWIASAEDGVARRTSLDFKHIDGSWKMVLDPLGVLGGHVVEVGGPSLMPTALPPGATEVRDGSNYMATGPTVTSKVLGSAQDGGEIIKWYTAELAKSGWKPPTATAYVNEGDPTQWMWSNGERVLWVHVQPGAAHRGSKINGKSLADLVKPGENVVMILEGHSSQMAMWMRFFTLDR